MRTLLPLFFAFVATADAQPAISKLPPDVAKFVERRDGCEHFAGEEPYDAERRKFIEKSIRELCTGTDRELAALKRKYSTNKAVMSRLSEYDPKVESEAKK